MKSTMKPTVSVSFSISLSPAMGPCLLSDAGGDRMDGAFCSKAENEGWSSERRRSEKKDRQTGAGTAQMNPIRHFG